MVGTAHAAAQLCKPALEFVNAVVIRPVSEPAKICPNVDRSLPDQRVVESSRVVAQLFPRRRLLEPAAIWAKAAARRTGPLCYGMLASGVRSRMAAPIFRAGRWRPGRSVPIADLLADSADFKGRRIANLPGRTSGRPLVFIESATICLTPGPMLCLSRRWSGGGPPCLL